MAAKTAPARTAAQHQSLLHFVGVASWSDEKVLAKVREMVLPSMQRHGPIEAWIIDDTGFPKHGKHSVSVQHQYCGQPGKEGERDGPAGAHSRRGRPGARRPWWSSLLGICACEPCRNFALHLGQKNGRRRALRRVEIGARRSHPPLPA